MMGGSFDPIHNGHLRAAEEVRQTLGLEKVLFIPTNIAPHKEHGPLTPVSMRLEMVRLSIKGNPGFEASDIEAMRSGKSYTIDTLTELTKNKDDVTLIIGSDSFSDIATWHRFQDILSLVDIAVMTRPGHPFKKPVEALTVDLATWFCYDDLNKCYVGKTGRRVYYIESTGIDISSTAIREAIKADRSIRYLVPEAAREYIIKRGLYK